LKRKANLPARHWLPLLFLDWSARLAAINLTFVGDYDEACRRVPGVPGPTLERYGTARHAGEPGGALLPPSTSELGAPDDRLTALQMLLFHQRQRPLHGRRFDATALVLVRPVEKSH
jgi:hypothetical protein